MVGSITCAIHARPTACITRPTAITGRVPSRVASTPASGATTIGIAVHGSVRAPASNGPKPCAVWKYWLIRKIAPKAPKNIANDRPFAALNARERKNRIGSIGTGVRRSHATKPASNARPAPSDARTVALVQPSASPRMIPKVSANRPALASVTPGRSSSRSGPRDSVSTRAAIGIIARPIGTFAQKIHCHAMPSTTAPPTNGPIATPSPLIPPQMPSAAARRSGGNASLISVRVRGVTMAAPRP